MYTCACMHTHTHTDTHECAGLWALTCMRACMCVCMGLCIGTGNRRRALRDICAACADCILGSANINDRSLLGDRDSEIAMLVKDDSSFVPVGPGSAHAAGSTTTGAPSTPRTPTIADRGGAAGLRASTFAVVLPPISEADGREDKPPLQQETALAGGPQDGGRCQAIVPSSEATEAGIFPPWLADDAFASPSAPQAQPAHSESLCMSTVQEAADRSEQTLSSSPPCDAPPTEAPQELRGAFCHSLRSRLFCEHLGIAECELSGYDQLETDAVFQSIRYIAENNTAIYEQVFNCIPSNRFKTLAELRIARLGRSASSSVKPSPMIPSTKFELQISQASHSSTAVELSLLKTASEGRRGATLDDAEAASIVRSASSSAESAPPAPDILNTDIDHVIGWKALSQIQGNIVVYPHEFLADEPEDAMLPSLGDKELILGRNFFL